MKVQRTRASRLTLLAVALMLASTLSACSTGSTSSSPAGTVPETASPSAEPPTTTPEADFSGAVELANSAGYRWSARYSVNVGTPQKSIANDRPGFATLEVPVISHAELTNLTPGRTAPVDEVGGFVFSGLYDASRAICGTVAGIEEVTLADPAGEYCWTIFSGQTRVSDSIGPAETMTFTPGDFGYRRLFEGGLTIDGIDEIAIDAVVDDIKNGPEIWVLGAPAIPISTPQATELSPTVSCKLAISSPANPRGYESGSFGALAVVASDPAPPPRCR